jgi:hypothetical protein
MLMILEAWHQHSGIQPRWSAAELAPFNSPSPRKTGGYLKHNGPPTLLTPAEFDEMMLEFDQAGDWMQDQLNRKRLPQGPTDPTPGDEPDDPSSTCLSRLP